MNDWGVIHWQFALLKCRGEMYEYFAWSLARENTSYGGRLAFRVSSPGFFWIRFIHLILIDEPFGSLDHVGGSIGMFQIEPLGQSSQRRGGVATTKISRQIAFSTGKGLVPSLVKVPGAAVSFCVPTRWINDQPISGCVGLFQGRFIRRISGEIDSLTVPARRALQIPSRMLDFERSGLLRPMILVFT
ncbi:hypothetical protein CA85_39970 [Allorhodopirellula solitaria]|uniref:Uncharacterized protein n=1 Tax=Allorhodopirellula solitaria TaxID=2527987 RepID=A0A5C5X0E8_9BACT|nr:hypothetical protein CA85_39970 [Allorhodopirellula solitaria]